MLCPCFFPWPPRPYRIGRQRGKRSDQKPLRDPDLAGSVDIHDPDVAVRFVRDARTVGEKLGAPAECSGW